MILASGAKFSRLQISKAKPETRKREMFGGSQIRQDKVTSVSYYYRDCCLFLIFFFVDVSETLTPRVVGKEPKENGTYYSLSVVIYFGRVVSLRPVGRRNPWVYRKDFLPLPI